MTIRLLDLPSEILLHIFSFLDIPDLAALAAASRALATLTTDPILHQYRLKVVSPSRLNHHLFSTGPQGHALRPTVGDLVHRGVIRGLGIERHWRAGNYFYSLNSIVQYENSLALFRRQAGHTLSVQLRRRQKGGSSESPLKSLLSSHVLPDIECSSPNIARSLLATVHKLKWSIQRDTLAKLINKRFYNQPGFGAWMEGSGRRVVQDGEKVRLAICPDIRQRVGFFEALGKA